MLRYVIFEMVEEVWFRVTGLLHRTGHRLHLPGPFQRHLCALYVWETDD